MVTATLPLALPGFKSLIRLWTSRSAARVWKVATGLYVFIEIVFINQTESSFKNTYDSSISGLLIIVSICVRVVGNIPRSWGFVDATNQLRKVGSWRRR